MRSAQAALDGAEVSYLHLTTMRPLLLLLLFLPALDLSAQRQWEINDSTSYAVGGDTVLIASRKLLYRQLPGGTELLRDFTVAEDEDMYIRDVDHWTSSDWYVVVGSRYIGNTTTLWRTTDAGVSWSVDESFVPATETVSITQMDITPDGTAYLFNGYYQSEILRSFDHGLTWSRWFQSLISHYYGIIPCGNTAFIYGMVGDAFRPTLWQVPDTLWDENDIWFQSGCHNVIPGCHYPPFGTLDYPDVVAHFEEVAEGLCLTLALGSSPVAPGVLTVNLEADGRTLRVKGLTSDAVVSVLDASGKKITATRHGERLVLPDIATGFHVLVQHDRDAVRHARFFVP